MAEQAMLRAHMEEQQRQMDNLLSEKAKAAREVAMAREAVATRTGLDRQPDAGHLGLGHVPFVLADDSLCPVHALFRVGGFGQVACVNGMSRVDPTCTGLSLNPSEAGRGAETQPESECFPDGFIPFWAFRKA